MAGTIRKSDIEQVKTLVNIADVVGEYVSLKNASAGSLKGLCPFHDEKSPSFNVRPAQGFYHCFGCGEGGDVFNFVQKLESLTFYEAVEKLAARIGYTLTYEEGGVSQDSGQRARILEANQMAATFFQERLMSEDALVGREFLKGRGFDKAAAELFGVGFAPKGWSALTEHLVSKGFTVSELATAGLTTLSEKTQLGGFDKFRGRLIWPVRDAANSVIGFGARKLFDDDQGPKYLNTSDTPVYHKSQVLYGIDLAKKDISKQHTVVVVEGYTDVMACHLAGVTTAVATCGTAFGDDHIRILNRMLATQDGTPSTVVFTFDPDAAGQKAAMRAFADSSKFKNSVTFVAVGPDGLDPCDLRSQRGDEAVRRMIETREPLFEFAIRRRIADYDLNSLEGRVGAVRAAAPILAAIVDRATRTAYTRRLTEWVPIDITQAEAIVLEASKAAQGAAVAHLNMDAAAATNGALATWQPTAGQIPAVNLNDPRSRVERAILEVLVQMPQRYSDEIATRVLGVFAAPAHAAIAKAIQRNLGSRAQGDWLNAIAREIPTELHQLLREIAASAMPVRADRSEMVARFVQGVMNTGLSLALEDEKVLAIANLARINKASEPAAYDAVQLRLRDIDQELQTLK